MIDTKEILNSNIGIKKTLDTLLNKKSQSSINLVRFATHFSDVNSLDKIVKLTKDKGYKIAINLMQTGGSQKNKLMMQQISLTNKRNRCSYISLIHWEICEKKTSLK